ncbi:uncharacterized protein LOC116181019 isoform X1 [Photinus pyralis]|uniref:uncharacterized protein LOC116181019 isoform X1 n=1 Tax=Photinus pyralis TaxID=7054 RepID=UPI001267212B|nr:uncharacterized protein LOC116181019 isoform X1 [Photinus pyralis]
MRPAVISIGILFFLVKLLSVLLNESILSNLFGLGKVSAVNIGRGNRIFMGFQLLAACTFLPFLCGACLRNPDLMLPLIIASIYNSCITILLAAESLNLNLSLDIWFVRPQSILLPLLLHTRIGSQSKRLLIRRLTQRIIRTHWNGLESNCRRVSTVLKQHFIFTIFSFITCPNPYNH